MMHYKSAMMNVDELFADFIQYVDSIDTNALRDNIRKAKEHSSEEICT